MAEVWYRVYEQRYAAPLDEFDNVCGVGTISVHCVEIPVIKHTEKGVWLNSFGGKGTFVRTNARKRYACPTKDEAYTSFFARKTRQLKILGYQMDGVKQAVELARCKQEQDRDKAFMEVVNKIITTRPNDYWNDGTLIHIASATPDSLTACGVIMPFHERYALKPDSDNHATCPGCLARWLQWSGL